MGIARIWPKIDEFLDEVLYIGSCALKASAGQGNIPVSENLRWVFDVLRCPDNYVPNRPVITLLESSLTSFILGNAK